jgi:tetratricopeptide (TPR) repeat protein
MELGLLVLDSDPEEAVRVNRRAVKISPDDARGHVNLGLALKKLGVARKEPGLLKEAVLSYERAIELNPRLYNAHLNLGNVLWGLGQAKEAIRCYRRAVKLAPGHAPSYHVLARSLLRLGEFAEARSVCQRARELLPPEYPVHKELAKVLRDSERLLELERTLPGVLKGDLKPRGADEQVELADFCLRSCPSPWACSWAACWRSGAAGCGEATAEGGVVGRFAPSGEGKRTASEVF